MMRISKVCLLIGDNKNRYSYHYTHHLNEALIRHGLDTKVLAFEGAIDDSILDSICRFDPDFTCSFDYCPQANTHQYWWDRLAIPHYFLMDDLPFYTTLKFDSPHLILSTVDRNDCAAMMACGVRKIFFLPFAADRDLEPELENDREYDVVFMGSCYDYESLRSDWQQRFSPSLNKAIDDAISIVFSDDTISSDKALLTACSPAYNKLSKEDLDNLSYCYQCVERYTRGKDRVELIRSIKNAHVHVFGGLASQDRDPLGKLDWSYYLENISNITLHPAVSYEESLKILKQSKIALLSTPFFRDGTPGGVFTALACGCLPVSSESKYLHEEFIAGGEIEFYQASRLENINERVGQWLADESKRQYAAAAGRQKVMQRHTWDNRVQTMLHELPPILTRIHNTVLESRETLPIRQKAQAAVKLQKVCLLTDETPSNSLHLHFTHQLAEAMRRHGIELKVVETTQGCPDEELSDIAEFSPDILCSFNTGNLPIDGAYWWDRLTIPYLSILLEPSFFSLPLLKSPYAMLSCIDRNDISSVLDVQHRQSIFLPHAVEGWAAPEFGDRPYDVVFIGSCYDYKTMRIAMGGRLELKISQFFDAIIEKVFSDCEISFDQAIALSQDLSPRIELPMHWYRYLYRYILGRDRVELIRSIKNAHVHIFGEIEPDFGMKKLDWKDYLFQQKNVTIHPPVNYAETLQILKKAKIVLNSDPLLRDGTHERVITGLACGCLPVTSESRFLREEFIEGEEILLYKITDRDEISERIDEMLSDEKKRQAAAAQGHEKVMQRHTWNNRVKMLAEVLPAMLAKFWRT